MSNPDPDRITDEMWKLWTDRPNKNWKLGGIYANKAHYHNSVEANLEHWPNSYSIKLPLDLVPINRDKARAIDLTMSDTEMVKWTARMRNSALDSRDHRLSAVKEFYGTLDGRTVFGLSKDNETGRWRHVTADKTHLWHGHVSIFAIFVANWARLSPLLSVWKGESFENWSARKVSGDLINKGDTGEEVKYWQIVHNRVRGVVNPPSSAITVDGDYGAATASAFADFWRKSGGVGSFDGDKLTGWLALQYHLGLISVSAPMTVAPNAELIKSFVNKWLEENLAEKLFLAGEVKGKVTFDGK